MITQKRVGFFRFASFYLLESAVYFVAAIAIGYLVSLYTQLGWPLACMFLGAFFSYRLALSISFTRYLHAKERAEYAGVEMAPFNTGGVTPYAAAFVGAVCGWELAVFTNSLSLLIAAVLYLACFYIVEVWRESRTF